MKTKHASQWFQATVVLFAFLCCQQSKSQSYKLEIVDSVQVDILSSSVRIADVHRETGEILVIQTSPPKLWLLSSKGEIKSTWQRKGLGPGAIGSSLLSAEFYGDGIAMMGSMRVKLFDRNFKLVKSMIPHYASSHVIYEGDNHLIAFEGPNGQELISYFGGPQTEFPPTSREFYNEFNIVDRLNPFGFKGETALARDSVYKPAGKLSEGSRYKNDRTYFMLKSVFDAKNTQLYYAINTDTVLYKLNLHTNKIENRYKIPFDEFFVNDGLSLGKGAYDGQNKPKDREGQIERVFSASGMEVVIYRSGLALAEYQAVVTGSDFLKTYHRKNPAKYLIVKNGKRLNSELQPPKGIRTFDMADDFGYIWAHQNISLLDEEPELITFYKLKIILDEN
ncbi:MAG: hypothetical protein JJ862_10655 [Roseivirga sp.]|jgi:hypothetical protein|uniref:hypothetical protein n=1 Tax=Roseivirga sp. TaxID=1964215 RepID=UPI001B27C8B9|nr:hypothetical protein [Roseivirga sp.]MBO6494112.1 hypothetical protein [Roseivirga sp.]MBO6661271.1 hypothetical protein [Roseivirga sp.]MBO6908745.1 hypothetical protein [Roseivirga sp.]